MFVMSAVTEDLVANGATAMVMIDKQPCFNKVGGSILIPSLPSPFFQEFTFSFKKSIFSLLWCQSLFFFFWSFLFPSLDLWCLKSCWGVELWCMASAVILVCSHMAKLLQSPAKLSLICAFLLSHHRWHGNFSLSGCQCIHHIKADGNDLVVLPL